MAESQGNIPWGSIIGGAATLGGAIIGYQGQKQTNAANAQQAKNAMDFEERMSNSAWQRATADMRAAGLNPALAYEKGGASTPGGKTAEIKNALAAFGGSAQAAVDTFNSINRTQADVQQTRANTELTKAQANQLNLESASRAEQIRANAAIAGTNAKFADATFNTREQALGVGLQRDVIEKDRARLDFQYTGDLYQRNKDVLWPLAVQQLKQDLSIGAFNTRSAAANAELSELQIPTARNIAKMADTEWGKKISPFLSDATSLARMLSIGANLRR